MKGIFGSMFDLNHDGNISPLESAMGEYETFSVK